MLFDPRIEDGMAETLKVRDIAGDHRHLMNLSRSRDESIHDAERVPIGFSARE